MSSGITGVLLLAFGGPDSPEAIEPFMKNLMGGRTPSPELVKKVKARYDLIGGKSPLPEITGAQARALEEFFRSDGGNYKVAVGMRHWRPFIGEGIENLLGSGADQVIGVSLAPFYSKVSTGAYAEELDHVITSLGGRAPRVSMAGPFFDNGFYLEAVAEKVRAALAGIPEARREQTRVIFSAHSLPVGYIRDGDPYVEQFDYSSKAIAGMVGLSGWQTAYQSKGGGQGEWLGPMVEEIMDRAKTEGATDVLVVPVGFVSDHIETLYDIDIAQKEHADSVGLYFHRAGSLNTSALFIKALAETVKSQIK